MPRQDTRPNKRAGLLGEVRSRAQSGEFLDTRHATDRRSERSITRAEIIHVLKHGFSEKAKDHFKREFGAWNYAIRGKTVDGRTLRVIVSFQQDDLIIITAIELAKPAAKP